MASQDDDQDQRVVAVVVIAAVLMSIALAIGMGIYKTRSATSKVGSGALTSTAAPKAQFSPANIAVTAPAAGEFSATAPGPAAAAVTAVTQDEARVVVENGVVKFYFASGKTELASGALEALGDAIAAAKAGKNLVISGFHDNTGDAALNADLAKSRAVSVHDALVNAGVAPNSLELKKPEQSAGTGNNAEARRVEVVIAG